MPRKKKDKDTAKPIEDARLTAPDLPEAQSKQIKINSESSIAPTKNSPVEEASQPDAETLALPQSSNIENPETDKAVDDIMAGESDKVLAIDDALAARKAQPTTVPGWRDKMRRIIHNKWTWIGIAVVLCVVFAVPYTRYKLLGIVFKENVQVVVIDSQTKVAVSSAEISLAGKTTKTDANGIAIVRAGVGEHTLSVQKQYYRSSDTHYFVSFKKSVPVSVTLIATGRQVPITVLNTISGKPVSNAVIRILRTTAKTNSKGQATIALPVGSTTVAATISLAGFNTKQTLVRVTNVTVSANSFALTPAGSLFFLSNQNTTVDVVKANLDGSSRQTVLTGTGHELPATTRLLTSRDWRYQVLEANRDGTRPALYLIDASNNQVSEFDNSNAAFTPIGWYGHNFLYSLASNTLQPWQSGAQIIKSYDADQKQLNQLDQNQALGSQASYGYQTFSHYYIVGNALIYSTQWLSQGNYDLSNENGTIRVVTISSQSKKDYESFSGNNTGTIQASRYLPANVYFAVTDQANSLTTYYLYNNLAVQTANIDQTTFDHVSPTYLLSPSGSHSLWSEPSNGQNLFLIGDSNGANQQQIASIDSYVPYGWYSDNYVLASRNKQLYIFSASSLASSRQPLKISSYFEPNVSSASYEYGGL